MTRDANSTDLVPYQPPAYQIGDAVRVRAGVMDPDFEDIPLSGWTGLIAEIDRGTQPVVYQVAWSDATLAQIPQVYRVRCEREGMELDNCWLAAADLQPDTGGPPHVETPGLLVPLPLDLERWDDRIRHIFGLTTDEPLPQLNQGSLSRFYNHFQQNLSFPVEAKPLGFLPKLGIIQKLIPPEPGENTQELVVEFVVGEKTEIVQLAELDLLRGGPLNKDLEAYRQWIDEQAMSREKGQAIFTATPLQVLGQALLICVLVGVLLGALYWTMEYSGLAAKAGATLLGFAGALIGANAQAFFRRINRKSPGFLLGGFLGGVSGAILGAIVAVCLLGYVGGIPGGILGTLAGQMLRSLGWRRISPFKLTMVGAYLGAMVYAFLLDSDLAVQGSLWGCGAGVVLFLVVVMICGVISQKIRGV